MIERAAGETIAPPSPWTPARDEQHALGLGDPAHQRCGGEQRDAGHEQPAPPEPVGSPAAEQQEAPEYQRVRVQDPGEALLREPDVALDRRQRDIDDAGVQDDHELSNGDDRQHRVRVDASGPTRIGLSGRGRHVSR